MGPPRGPLADCTELAWLQGTEEVVSDRLFFKKNFLPSLMAYRISCVTFFLKAIKVLRDSLKSLSNLETTAHPGHSGARFTHLRAPCRLHAEIQTLSRGLQGPLPTISRLNALTPAKPTGTGNLGSGSDPVGPKEGIGPWPAPIGAGTSFLLILGSGFHLSTFLR